MAALISTNVRLHPETKRLLEEVARLRGVSFYQVCKTALIRESVRLARYQSGKLHKP